MNAREQIFATLSREAELVCRADGTVLWCDGRAERYLGVKPSASLTAQLVPGSETRLKALFDDALAGHDRTVELSVLVAGQPKTFAFKARAVDGDVAIIASLLPEEAGRTLEEVSGAMNDLSELHRLAERQKRELQERNDELVRLQRALNETSRGMMNLYAELDDKSDSLRQSAEVKSRVLANISHEFRTPLNSITGLGKLLLSKIDGPLTPEQEKQISFMIKSADELSMMVNDVLDLSRLEAGSVRLRPAQFRAGEMLGGLRGMLRPLERNPAVTVTVEEAPDVPLLHTDEGKVSQILRHLLSNALKFTERGEVRISCEPGPGSGLVTFKVSDTGIGIDPADQPRIFEEFVQLDGPVQRRLKGAGLGLALSKRLAQMLGGTLRVESAVGRGSTFTLVIPPVHPEVLEIAELFGRSRRMDTSREAPVLVVEDDPSALLLYEKYLHGSGFGIVPARTIDEAREALQRVKPVAAVLDVMLQGDVSWAFLRELKSTEATRDIPVIVVTIADREEHARALGANDFFLKPVDQTWLLRKLRTLSHVGPVQKVLIIDDDEISRYLIKRLLTDSPYAILEASTSLEGLKLARAEKPNVALLDFTMPGTNVFELIDSLKADPVTSGIPIIIHTARPLSEGERRRLAPDIAAVLSKDAMSREVALARIREVLARPIPAATG